MIGKKLFSRVVEEGLEETALVAEAEAVGQCGEDRNRVGRPEPVSVGKVFPPGNLEDGGGREADQMADRWSTAGNETPGIEVQ